MDLWADLSRDLLELIAERIIEHKDVLCFGITCKSWYSVVVNKVDHIPHKLPLCHCFPYKQPLPLLMLCYNGEASKTPGFFSLRDKKLYGEFFVPEINRKWICGSTNGWLVVIEIHGRQIQLLNAFTRAQKQLPSLSDFQHPNGGFMDGDFDDFGFVEKVIISSEPTRNDCIVMAIISNFSVLSFCRLGDERWTNVKGSPIFLTDVIPYKGQFYAVNDGGALVACDVDDMKIIVVAASVNTAYGNKRYLVESASGDLLQVVRKLGNDNMTCNFIVYKLQAIDETEVLRADVVYSTINDETIEHQEFRFKWVKTEGLDDQMLFIGRNCSLALSAQLYPRCRGNSIYFTDDVFMGHLSIAREDYDMGYPPYDMGIFNMEDGSIERFGWPSIERFGVPPFWVIPNPW